MTLNFGNGISFPTWLHRPWWQARGITPSTCVAAYQPKGARDLASSYINLANPGTYNAAPGTAPTWDVVNGWKFLGSSSQYLTTGIVVSVGWSIVVRFSNWSVLSTYLFGAYDGATTTIVGICPWNRNTPDITNAFWNGKIINRGIIVGTSGVYTISGANCYANGMADGTLINAFAPTNALYISALNKDGVATFLGTGYIQAFAIYNTTLIAAQVLAVTNAMNLL